MASQRVDNEPNTSRGQQTSHSRRIGRSGAAHRYGPIEIEDTIGQFAFGPATQTTVVTTTTTTTTQFPPFVMRAPRRPEHLDSRIYPLSNIQTPTSLRRIAFSHDGKQVIFREAADTTLALEEAVEEQERLRRGNGVVRHVQQSNQYGGVSSTLRQPSLGLTSDSPASPMSIDEPFENDEDLGQSPASSLRGRRAGKQAIAGHLGTRSLPRLNEVQASNPFTPETHSRSKTIHRRSSRAPSAQPVHNQPLLPSPDTEHQGSATLLRGGSLLTREALFESELSARSEIGRNLHSRASHETTVPTPPVEPEETQANTRPLSRRALSSIPSRLHVSDSPSSLEGNLPSPSLSPVTAAANAHHTGYFHDADSSLSQPARSILIDDGEFDETPSHGRYGSPAATDTEDQIVPTTGTTSFSGTTIADMPAMLDFFEALPDELKSYAMHQLLRRCPKSTLHLVAEAINPALKCDFLSVLPAELGLNILSHLDVRSLCKAAQVSRKWRQIINSDEKAWKELFDADGFVLPEGELQKAITQGWGWQDPYGAQGCEQDLSVSEPLRDDSDSGSPTSSTVTSKRTMSGSLRRSKRKAGASLLSNRNKQLKRTTRSREVSVDIESIDWMAQMSTAEGPYNAANAAILAVPSPKLSIPGLKGLHLYKSLYRRHHFVRRNWMLEDTKPRHIAFRAHDSHVVTCLQFDTDKILTGSDDNNINVYDTKTGALRQLLRGHEGGVWALQYDGNTLVSGSTDRSVRVWDIDRGIETQVFRGHTSTVRCLQIVTPVKVGETADGKPVMQPKRPLIITGSRDSTLRVWYLPRAGDAMFIQAESDTETDDCPYFIRTLTGHQHSVRAIAAHADTLVSGSYDCTVRVWKISTGETVHRLQGHSQKVYSVVLDVQRNRCISGSMDNLVKIWSLDTGSALFTLEGHSSLVGLLDLNCDRLVSAAADSTLRIWDPENGQCKATLSAHTGAITCFQHDGQKVVSGSDRTLKMWNVKTGECMKDLLSDLSGVWQVKFNERRCVAAVQRDNMTYIEVLDFGASRDGVPEAQRGRRVVVDVEGREVNTDPEDGYAD